MKAPKKNAPNAIMFNAQSDDSPVMSAEITIANEMMGGDNHYGTFVTSNAINEATFNAIAQKSGVQMEISSATTAANGGNIFVVKSADDLSKLVAGLNENGANLVQHEPEKPAFNPWKWRAITSLVGQSLQISSSVCAKNSSPDVAAMAGFGALNLVANACNWTFGSQHNSDAHQLAFLKQQFTQAIAPLVEDASKLPQLESDPTKSRLTEYPKKSLGAELFDTAKHYSVSVGEVGLRTIGATCLAYPINKWGEMAGHLVRGDVMGAHNIGRNTNQVTYNAGLATLVGKGLSMIAKEEDPFNPKDKNFIDTFREKIAFRASSIIEGGASAYMLADRLNMVDEQAPKKAISVLGVETDYDWLGASGNLVFIGGYGIRLTAPYGTLDVDMKHLYAHISDCLNEVPKEILPQTLMASATSLKNHFADSKITFTEIYSGIADDLLHHHGVDVAMWENINQQNMVKMEQRMNVAMQPVPSISEAQMMGMTATKQLQVAL